MKSIHEKFSSLDLLLYLNSKILNTFYAQTFISIALKEALKKSEMIGLLGREGMGKSTAIAKLVYQIKGIYYVRIGQSYTVKNFIDELLFQITDVYPSRSESPYLKIKRLSGLLTQDDSKKLIIVDDSGKLSPRGLGFFHELRDNTMHCVGFAFVGVSYLQDNLRKAKDRGVPGVAEFYRRIQKWVKVPGLTFEDLKEYAKARKLTDKQIELMNLKKVTYETIAELEIMVNTILEFSDSELQREISTLNGSKKSNKQKDRGAKSHNDKHKKKSIGYDMEDEYEDYD